MRNAANKVELFSASDIPRITADFLKGERNSFIRREVVKPFSDKEKAGVTVNEKEVNDPANIDSLLNYIKLTQERGL